MELNSNLAIGNRKQNNLAGGMVKPAIERKVNKMAKPKTFVICKFAETVKLIFPQIQRMYYRIDTETKEEFVDVAWKTDVAMGIFSICVTADSNASMIDDVWTTLKRKFG